MNKTLYIIKNLLREVRKNNFSCIKNKYSPMVSYILSQCHKYQVTDEQFCQAQKEMKFLAETYLCYLKSQRIFNEINAKYQGKAEKSIKEIAEVVGFKLPHDHN